MIVTDPLKLKTLMPYISGSNILLTGLEDAVIGLKYDEANMFIPIIMLMEKGISVQAIKQAAAETNVPVVKNDNLVKNLLTYGKLGDIIPELCCREAAAIIARTGKPDFRITEKTAVHAGAEKKTSKRPRPIKIETGQKLMDFLEGPGLLRENFEPIRKELSWLFGYGFPSPGISVNGALAGGGYRIMLKGIEAGRGTIDLNWFNWKLQVVIIVQKRLNE